MQGMEWLRTDLLRGASPALGQMIFATQLARDVVVKVGRPVRSEIAGAAVKVLGSAWSTVRHRFPDAAEQGTHSWLKRLNAFGVSRASTVDGFAAYADALHTRAPYIDATLTAMALELAAQALALGYDDLNGLDLKLGEEPEFRDIFAAALCGMPARLNDNIAPFGPFAADSSRVVTSFEDVVINAAFLPQMEVTVTLAKRTKLTMDRMGFAALCGNALGDTTMAKNAGGNYTLRAPATMGADARAVQGIELSQHRIRQLGHALEAFLSAPLVERWVQRLCLTTGWV